ncbi:TPA: hypothetical protein RU593_004914 [Salmonella enterica]|nr:hypothetical protein [Salmonella enterica]
MDFSVSSASSHFPGCDNASVYIDSLLQDTYLFVMDIYHQPAQARDEALYHYAVMLVETVQEKLEKALHEVFGLPLSEKLEKKEVTEAGDNVQENYSHGISSKIMMINY